MASIRLSEATEARLQKAALATKRSKSYLVKEAIQEYLEDIEEAYIALERISRPGRRRYTSKQVDQAIKSGKKPK